MEWRNPYPPSHADPLAQFSITNIPLTPAQERAFDAMWVQASAEPLPPHPSEQADAAQAHDADPSNLL